LASKETTHADGISMHKRRDKKGTILDILNPHIGICHPRRAAHCIFFL
jgi:hypothetical protein